ncbi:IclR family transcriptional regulator [Acidiphilium iwatense]|uniref:IclR family transcriptional regulator n=1 Tax=Acidiphilium iwatense TaxID=768198 RepID=A0ABS9E165_9PROT|nr:IclR family transcriptional regulator [Acidiphilium iwatense]MCF3948752.1 IclR family transcriptional regulator [Acidiphilium iwatense]
MTKIDDIRATVSFDPVDVKADHESPSASGSLLRGLSLIEALAEAPSPLLLVELAERVRLDSSTVYRLMQTLCVEGFAVRLSSKRYCAGPRAIRLLSNYHPVNSLCNETGTALRELRDRVGETVMLIIFVGAQRVIVAVVQGREILSPSYETWLRTPIHGSASGKIMLMQLNAKRQEELLGPPPYCAATEFTVRDEDVLRAQLDAARACGFTVARDDALVGMTAIAAPITWNGHSLGCIAIVGNSSRLGREIEGTIGAALRETATLIVNAAPSVRTLANFLGA